MHHACLFTGKELAYLPSVAANIKLMRTTKLPVSRKATSYVMADKAHQHNAIDLVSGLADFSMNENLGHSFNYYLQKGEFNYAPTRGLPKLREILARMVYNRFGADFEPEKEVAITAGATQAISTAITAFVKENDEVVVLEPSYDIYTPLILMNGGIPVYVDLTTPGYKIDWVELNRAITSRTKLIIFNNPHNPTGSVFGSQDLQKLQKVLNGSKILLLADEVFEHYTYDGKTHTSVAQYPELSNRSLIVSSIGKTFSANGLRLGYVIAQEEIMNEFIKFHQYMVDSVNTPLQYAVASFFEHPEKLEEISQTYQHKRDLFLGMLKDSVFSFTPAEGTYFQLMRYDKLGNERDTVIIDKLLTEYGVAGVPLSSFYHGKSQVQSIRFSFMRKDDTLKQAAERLLKVQP